MRPDVYQIITNQIVALLEAGTVPWHRPWNTETGLPRNLATGKPYRGINVFLLGAQPFASPWWLTFRQAKERGGSVRKGEKATPVIFWKISQYTAEDADTGEEDGGAIVRPVGVLLPQRGVRGQRALIAAIVAHGPDATLR